MAPDPRSTAWQGQWIWAAELLPHDLQFDPLPPPTTWNRFCYLRTTVELAAAPASVPARVTADSRYVLYVNGTEAARGPARSVPERLAYDEVDLAPLLTVGANVIAAQVRFYGRPGPWWQPALPSFQLGFGSFAFEAPSVGVVSDASWRVRVAPYRSPSVDTTHGVATEIVDGAGVPHGWTTSAYDDTGWAAAAVVTANPMDRVGNRPGTTPFTRPEPSGIAALTGLDVALRPVASGCLETSVADDPLQAYTPVADSGDAFTTYDVGGLTLATPRLTVAGAAGSVVDIYVGEDVDSDGRAVIAPRQYALRYQLAGTGEETAEGFDAVGFRYLTAVTRGPVDELSIAAVERRYPRPEGAGFACDDPVLNDIWTAGVRTLELCSTDAFIDCPGREQRAWAGDSYVHALVTFVASPDPRLVRRHLRMTAQGQRRDGLLGMTGVGDLSMISLTIPDWSLHWVRELARYYDYTADTDTVVELLPVAADILGYFDDFRSPDGLLRNVPGWVFVDWAQTERADVVGALDALVAATATDVARLVEQIDGDRRLSARARAVAAAAREGFERLWDDDRGVYVDAIAGDTAGRRVSQQTNAMAILGGCAPAARWPRMLDAILDRKRLVVTRTPGDRLDDPGALFHQWADPAADGFDPETAIVAAQPFYRHFVHQAVVQAGRVAELPDLIRDWHEQLLAGATTFGEYWTSPPGAGSRCHAWSTTPTYDLTTHVLGVTPTAPGFVTARVAPFFGPLQQISGRVPTPHGWLDIDLHRERGGSIAIPNGVTVDFEPVDSRLTPTRLGAGRHDLSPGPEGAAHAS
jgi:alpha-L-rhamnosidase